MTEAAPRACKSLMRNSLVTPEWTSPSTSKMCWPRISGSWLKKISIISAPPGWDRVYFGLMNWQTTGIFHGPDEVCHEHEGVFQDRQHLDGLPLVIVRNLAGQLLYPWICSAVITARSGSTFEGFMKRSLPGP